MHKRLSVLLGFLGLLASGCIGSGPDPVAPPAANAAIVQSSVPLFDSAEVTTVECDGPADEVALLGGLCGADAFTASGYPLSGGWGRETDLGNLELYVMGDPEDFSTLEFAAFVTPSGGSREPVTEGSVHVTMASNTACSSSFTATATFLWRGTTIRVPWSSTVPC